MFKPRSIVLGSMVLIATMSRLIPHPPNLTPMVGLALFGGAQFSDKRAAFMITFASLLLSDLFLGFHSQLVTVYGSFGIILLIGFWLRRQRSTLQIAGAALLSSVLFFIFTNFGVWLFDSIYSKDLNGLAACYAAAVPFFKNTLAGDLISTALLFGSFWIAERKLPVLRKEKVVLA